MKPPFSDKTLVSEILQGNESYLHSFYSTYKPDLTRFVARYVAHQEDAEEIVQDTLMDCLEAFRDFTFKSTLYTFLCAIAKRKCFDYYRKKKISNFMVSRFPLFEHLINYSKTPEAELDEKLLAVHISRTLEKLSPQYRTILKLKYIEGYSVQRIADELSLSFKTVESALFRARKAFVVLYNT